MKAFLNRSRQSKAWKLSFFHTFCLWFSIGKSPIGHFLKRPWTNYLDFNEFWSVLRYFWPGYQPYSLNNSEVQLIVPDNCDQRFDSVANSQLVPSDFQLLKALSNLGLMCKMFKTWGTNCELDPEPLFWNFPNENWEICEKQSKTGKSRTFKNHPFGIKTFKYGPHTF